MFDKSFDEMMKIDVSPYVKERDDAKNAKYLNWAICKKLLHDNGAEVVMFNPVPAADGSTLRMSTETFKDSSGKTNRAYEVLVHIKVDNLEWDTAYPVMNGNNPVKDNSMSQLRVHNAVRRAFVKGVAERIGLGFSLWLDDDMDEETEEENLQKHSLEKIKQRFQEEYTCLLVKGLSASEIAEKLQMSVEEVKAVFAQFDTLQRFEERLKSL